MVPYGIIGGGSVLAAVGVSSALSLLSPATVGLAGLGEYLVSSNNMSYDLTII